MSLFSLSSFVPYKDYHSEQYISLYGPKIPIIPPIPKNLPPFVRHNFSNGASFVVGSHTLLFTENNQQVNFTLFGITNDGLTAVNLIDNASLVSSEDGKKKTFGVNFTDTLLYNHTQYYITVESGSIEQCGDLCLRSVVSVGNTVFFRVYNFTDLIQKNPTATVRI